MTSMPQLVAGLSALHPEWSMEGSAFGDRDRHHSAVRRRLRDLAAMGLLRWRVGVDDDGQERRTELELLEAPPVSVEELAAAGEQLAAWQARYGSALNTGSSTGVRNAAGHGRPLSSSERRRRGRVRALERVRARQGDRGHQSNSAPPCGASAPPKNTTVIREASDLRKACERTGARASANTTTNNPAAFKPTTKTAGTEEREFEGGKSSISGAAGSGETAQRPERPVWDSEALVARVKAREEQRAAVIQVIAAQAAGRAKETAEWGPDRGWPYWRLREAWVVARWGANAAADWGPAAAGPLDPEDYERLRRAVRRYDSNVQARPPGWPVRGLGGLLMLGAEAGGRDHGPRTLRYAIGALDQLSRRMRAVATEDSTRRLEAGARRAQKRHSSRPVTRPQFRFRKVAWPAWVLCDGNDQPVFERGLLQVDAEHPSCPQPGSVTWRITVRDAYLAAGRVAPLEVDGRAQMAARYRGEIPAQERAPHRGLEQRELAELGRLTGLSVASAQRVAPDVRAAMLAQLRVKEAERSRAEIKAFRETLQRTLDRPALR